MAVTNAAIVGIGCRVRGARTTDSLFRELGAPPLPFSHLPADRWDEATFGPAPYGGLLEDYDIDFRAFRTPPVQAAQMHRMERAAMAAMHGALIDAGLTRPGPWSERTSIHIGASTLGFDPAIDHMARLRMPRTMAKLDRIITGTAAAGARQAIFQALSEAAPPISIDSLVTTASMAAGRVANAFDFGGGHLAYDCGASSSLAALAAAITALDEGECDLAFVAAVSPLFTPTVHKAHARRGLLGDGDSPVISSDGLSSGTILAEGAIALVLEREDMTRARNGRIYAVVRGVGVSSAGRRSTSQALAPCVTMAAQRALEIAQISPDTIDYIECQAAGLPGIDESERRGLAAVYGAKWRPAPAPLATTAAHLGWLGAASGLASVAMAALTIAHGKRPLGGFLTLPPTIADNVQEYRPENGPIRGVGVSSPGLGSVVYHAVLSDADGTSHRDRPHREPDTRIAIVGMGAVMPGAPNLGAFWSGILTGSDALAPLPPDADEPPGPPPADQETFIGGLVPLRRDPARLRAAPVSLPYIDGAVVLSVDACAQALEDAGFRGGAWDPTRVAVYTANIALRRAEFETERAILAQSSLTKASIVLDEVDIPAAEKARLLSLWESSLRKDTLPISEETLDCLTSFPGAARVAARYDFRGGAVAVDGACASSLSAIHLAARALARGEIDVAVVSGTSYHVVPEYLGALRTLGTLSVKGSRPFDPEADGMVPSEGAGAVVLKRLTDALRDRDRIYAVIGGTGVSSDGRGTAPLAPNTMGQQRALSRAYTAAQVAPTEIDLIEAHGTGTQEGDATELETYAAVFAKREPARPIVLGSVKSNIGHLSSAAGMAGLIKCALALHHRVLPPMRHRGTLSPAQEAILGGRLAITVEARSWSAPPGGAPRRAGVSSFGLGGVNAHVVLEEFLTVTERPSTRPVPQGKAGTPANMAQRLCIELVPLWRPKPAAPYPPTPGIRVLIAIDSGRALAKLADAIATKLTARGARPLIWEAPDHASLPNLEARLRALDAEIGGITGAIDLGTLAAAGERGGLAKSVRVADSIASGQAVHTVRRVAAIARALYRRFEEHPRETPPFFLAATGMGGTMGFFTGSTATAGGAVSGFLKGLKQELPALFARAVDFDLREDPAFIAETLIAELATGGDRVEVGYQNRRRFIPVLRLAPLSAKEIVPLPRQGAVLFSGGSRGVVFECARALSRHGLRAVITGRTPMPRGDERWLTMSDDELEVLRREEMLARHRKDPSLTPVRFAREWEPVVRARELARNLAAARASGEPIEYIACDVLDPDEVAALVTRVRARHGRIAGLVHGAMVEQSRSLPNKSFEMIDETVRVKLLGLSHLLAATASDPLHFIVAFGSIAGRFGNRGQADYCAANDAMARSLSRYAAEARPGVRCVTLEWTGWKHMGSLSDLRTAELLEKSGVVSIEPEEGVRWFLNEITRGDRAQTVVICSEHQAASWPFFAHVSDATGLPPTELDDLGRPLLSSDHPLIDAVVETPEPGRAVIERTFGPARDLFLADHHVGETPVLPGAFAMELLAEAAYLADKNQGEIYELRNVILESPVRFPRGDRTLRVHAEWSRSSDGTSIVETRASADVLIRGAVLEKGRTYYRGTVIVGPRRANDTEPAPSGGVLGKPSPTSGDFPPSMPDGAREGSLFERVTTPVCLGPRFLPILWHKRTDRGVLALVREPDESDLFSTTAAPRFLLDPMILDAAFQVAANWDAWREGGWLSIPAGLAQLIVGARRDVKSKAGAVLVEARYVAEEHPEVRYDVSVRGPGGKLLLEIRGLMLHRLDPTPREAVG